MTTGLLQTWGGVFYLLNKIFLSRKERSPEKGREWRLWNIAAWAVYIVGLPAWLVILYRENDLMVTLVEAGGAPAMVLGLVLALRRLDKKPSWFRDLSVKILDRFAVVAAIVGVAVSVWKLGFMIHVSQWVELGVTVGFLVGTYRLAKDHLDGYGWFFLMNASAGILMFMQGYFWLALQQAVSLVFVADAWQIKSANEQYFKNRVA